MPRIEFTCSRAGFAATGEGGLLGGFDGRDRRELHLYAVAAGPEQMLVSMHEQLHHELQWSTAWGLVAAMAGLLADEGIERERLEPLAAAMNASCRRVHEVFATTVSCGVVGLRETALLFDDNPVYRAHLEDGLSLGGEANRPWQLRESAIQMLLRSLMQPAHLGLAAQRGFASVRLRDVFIDDALTPDSMLERVQGLAPGWWAPTFTALLEEFPQRGGDRGDASGRVLPKDVSELEALKAWEEQILIPRLREAATRELVGLGLPVLDQDGYLETVGALRASFVSMAPSDWQVDLLTEHRSLTQEPLGAERESIRLHHLPAAVVEVSESALVDEASRFLHQAPTSAAGTGSDDSSADTAPDRIIALYLPRSTFARQFLGLSHFDTPGPPALALAGKPVLDESVPLQRRHVPLVFIRPDIDPATLTGMFATLPVTTLTSLTACLDAESQQRVLALEQAFVLVDLPLVLQVTNWIGGGFKVRFRVIGLTGDRSLNLLVFGLDELPSLTFLAYRSDVGFGEVAQLLDRHSESLHTDLAVSQTDVQSMLVLTSWLFAAWHRIEEVS